MIHRLTAALSDRYRLDRELGAGGMATVYLAHDLKHERDVAIKVLHPDLGAALGGERFLTEIRTTARLQHPHILPLLDSGAADGLLYYVMPLVTGETLRARLDREKQLPIADAVRIAREVASALDYAHRQNVIHRDIKPENVLLHDGSALVADFGIALAVQSAGGQRMTQTGLSLGTPSYMSPEQAMGERAIDARSDVYALGAMTYEMLAGEPPFTGPTVQAIVAKVMSTEPVAIGTLRKAVPPHVAVAVHSALEKLPADRCESAKVFSDMLGEPRSGLATATGLMTAAAPPPARATRLPLMAASLVAIVSLGAAAYLWQQRSSGGSEPVVPLTLETPNANPDLSRFAVSPDGQRFAFDTDEGIALRDIGQREYRVLPGTDRSESPTFSPDGEWIAYNHDGLLRKVPVAGGAPIAVIAGDSVRSGRVNWGDDGTMVFESGGALAVLPPKGPIRRLPKAISGEQPRMTPDGKGVFYVDNRQNARLMYYDLAEDSAYVLIEGAAEGQLLPTGHLLYAASTNGLYTIGLNASRHAVEGTPTPVLLDMQPNGGVAPFIVTRSGMLVYRAGVDAESRALIRQSSGTLDTLPFAPRVLSYARFSPDGKQLAFTVGAARGTNRHTAIYDFATGALTRLTQSAGAHAPMWSPDGLRMAFTAETAESDAEDIFVQPIDQSVPPRLVARLPNDQHASSWPNDSTLLVSDNAVARTLGGTNNSGSVHVLNPARPAPPRKYLGGAWGEFDAIVSPNGEWVLFTSMESGQAEVHLRRFDGSAQGAHWKVSNGSGTRARWSADGHTALYMSADNSAFLATDLLLGDTPRMGATRTLLKGGPFGSAWDVDHASGRLVLTEKVTDVGVRIIVMQHWLEHFRQSVRERPSR
jgi:serine/threonine-protein kinase